MGIKQIHIALITISIILCLMFGFWVLNHDYKLAAYCSFAVAIALIVYCVQFIKKTKVM